ncbi:MAG: TIGR02678 family protein [Actinobacteria bacterium]|nr:TIGR02678 family protein [Actinomycetota bacterium]
MPESLLAAQLDADRGVAVRTLLRTPILDASADADGFAAVVRTKEWLIPWFEQTCGWTLSVDTAGRTARLAKRSPSPDASRTARRARGERAPFDRRRYELLCLSLAELSGHPVTTIGILAGALAAGGPARLDTARHRERAAFIDALLLLARWGIVRFEGGDPDSFVDNEHGNAMVFVDTGRLHRLLASEVPPSRVDVETTEAATAALTVEPRYGEPDDRDDETRLRWIRHSIARRVIDDPVVHFEDLTPEQVAYLENPAGRKWLRDRMSEAGFVMEHRAEGVMAIDPERVATDDEFPAPSSTVKQVALLLVASFVRGDILDRRVLVEVPMPALTDAVGGLLAEHPAWARQHREGEGPARLAAEAVALLARFDLVRVDPPTEEGGPEVVRPRPALARYAAAAPRLVGATGTLFDDIEEEAR